MIADPEFKRPEGAINVEVVGRYIDPAGGGSLCIELKSRAISTQLPRFFTFRIRPHSHFDLVETTPDPATADDEG